MRVGSAAHVHVEGFTCVSRGLRAHSAVNVRMHNVAGGSLPPCPGARQCARATHTPGNCPKRRPLRPQQCFSTVFWRGGLRFGRHTTSNSARAAAKRGGNCIIRAATRRRHADAALRMAQNPHRYQYRARCRGGRARMGRRSVADARQLHTRQGATTKQISPNKNHAAPLRYKTLPAHPFSPHVRYKTLPARPKWLNLALFLHAGRVLYRCHHQEAEQGEFCTVCEAEMGLANTTGHQAHRHGGRRRAWPRRRWAVADPAAVSTNNSNTPPKQISHAIPPRHESMHAQKPQNIND